MTTTILIRLDGHEYVAPTQPGTDVDTAVKALYDDINELTKVHLQLVDGSVLILNQQALKRAVFVIQPSPI